MADRVSVWGGSGGVRGAIAGGHLRRGPPGVVEPGLRHDGADGGPRAGDRSPALRLQDVAVMLEASGVAEYKHEYDLSDTKGGIMERENRAKLSVTVNPNLYHVITQHAEREKVSKSRVVEEAVRLWEKSRLALLAKEGYQKMGREDVRDAEAYLPALSDLLED